MAGRSQWQRDVEALEAGLGSAPVLLLPSLVARATFPNFEPSVPPVEGWGDRALLADERSWRLAPASLG